MAVIYIDKLEDFLYWLNQLHPQRYSLWYDIDQSAFVLIPTVTSRHTHTYIFYTTSESEIEQIKKAWSGRVFVAKKIELSKW